MQYICFIYSIKNHVIQACVSRTELRNLIVLNSSILRYFHYYHYASCFFLCY
jgi:hypothetical protein